MATGLERLDSDGDWAAAPNGGLVGREAELGFLRASVKEVAAGRGGSVWVEGEPGIGKSTLVRAGVAPSGELGCEMFWGESHELMQRFPLRTILDALRVLPGSMDEGRAEIAELLWQRSLTASSSATPTDVLAAAAERVLVLVDRLCAVSPVVLVGDDLQWADAMSLAVWARLQAAVGQLPLLLVGVYRPVPARPEWPCRVAVQVVARLCCGWLGCNRWRWRNWCANWWGLRWGRG